MRFPDQYKPLIRPTVLVAIVVWLVAIVLFGTAGHRLIRHIGNQSRITALTSEIMAMAARQEALNIRKDSLKISDDRLSPLLAGLMRAGRKARLQLGEISIGEEKPRDGFRIIPLTLTMKGTYNQIGRFVNYVEREEIRLQFQAVDLAIDDKTGTGIIAKLKAEFISL